MKPEFDRARAEALVVAANARQECTHRSVPDVCDSCYREREFNLRSRGVMLEQALAYIAWLEGEVERLPPPAQCRHTRQGVGEVLCCVLNTGHAGPHAFNWGDRP